VEAYFLSAQFHFAAGNAERALERVRQVRDAAPLSGDIAFQTGLLLYQNGRIAEARQEFERTLTLIPSHENARYFLGLAYDQAGMLDQAVVQFQVLLQANPDNAEIRRILDNLSNGLSALEGISGETQPETATDARGPYLLR
jgi:tetratricopeptide (TPR) repeat protein